MRREHSRMAAGSKCRALSFYISVRICHMLLTSKRTRESDLSLYKTWVLAKRMPHKNVPLLDNNGTQVLHPHTKVLLTFTWRYPILQIKKTDSESPLPLTNILVAPFSFFFPLRSHHHSLHTANSQPSHPTKQPPDVHSCTSHPQPHPFPDSLTLPRFPSHEFTSHLTHICTTPLDTNRMLSKLYTHQDTKTRDHSSTSFKLRFLSLMSLPHMVSFSFFPLRVSGLSASSFIKSLRLYLLVLNAV